MTDLAQAVIGTVTGGFCIKEDEHLCPLGCVESES